MSFYDGHPELLDSARFLDSCSSLISTYYEYKDSAGSVDCYVKLAHFTVKEFPISDAVWAGSCLEFAMEKRLAHACLSKSCLAYFHGAVLAAVDDVWGPNLLARYVAHFWTRHKELSDEEWVSGEL